MIIIVEPICLERIKLEAKRSEHDKTKRCFIITYVQQAVEGLIDDLDVIDSDPGDAVVPEFFPTDDAVPI